MKDVPADLTEALEKAGLAEFFRDCTPAHRREYVQWIVGAKKPETRASRIAQAVKMIAVKKAQEK
ncbi:MAG TPA: YdeI/OmpD-associated family protein [Bryobacteraceae bacterium]|nr:YdeI/OmpD-associated family protein [Bryobacteraceae bacterium]